jgi:hypothetical protein
MGGGCEGVGAGLVEGCVGFARGVHLWKFVDAGVELMRLCREVVSVKCVLYGLGDLRKLDEMDGE